MRVVKFSLSDIEKRILFLKSTAASNFEVLIVEVIANFKSLFSKTAFYSFSS